MVSRLVWRLVLPRDPLSAPSLAPPTVSHWAASPWVRLLEPLWVSPLVLQSVSLWATRTVWPLALASTARWFRLSQLASALRLSSEVQESLVPASMVSPLGMWSAPQRALHLVLQTEQHLGTRWERPMDL